MLRLVSAILAALAVAAGASTIFAQQLPLDNAFTYQGRLTDAGLAPTGIYDIQFSLWEQAAGGTQHGSTITLDNVQVTGGLFTTRLDFGPNFLGYKRWMQIAVRPGISTGAYTTLTPRQEITPTPFALWAVGPWTAVPSLGLRYDFQVGIDTAPTLTDRLLVSGASNNTYGVHGISTSGGLNAAGVYGECDGSNTPVGVIGRSTGTANGSGMNGIGSATGGYFQATNSSGSSVGVYAIGTQIGMNAICDAGVAAKGSAASGTGVNGISFSGSGVAGQSVSGAGVYGVSTNFIGVNGVSTSNAGVYGLSTNGRGIEGHTGSTAGVGVSGDCTPAGTYGYLGHSTSGVLGHGGNFDGVYGESGGASKSGVVGISSNGGGIGGYFQNTAGGVALKANGLAQVNTLQILGGSDLAEPFDVSSADDRTVIQPGMVVSIDPAKPGDLKLSIAAYDTRVAGIISGANNLAPGMIMSAKGQAHADGRYPIAMTGRVWCWVDATFGEVRPGDALTTCATPGMAMLADNGPRACGASIGKAMTGLKDGRGLVLVLVNLH